MAANTTGQLIPETSFPNLDAGQSYRGMHILDVLEVLGGANLRCRCLVRTNQRLRPAA